MLYLEDYLEMIEHLPQELRDRFTEMRELDLSVQNTVDSLDKQQRSFFARCKQTELPEEEIETEYEALRKEYHRVLEDADEKVNISSQIHELVERYLRRLDSELFKFKCELEADNNGITEILEKRSLEMDSGCSAASALLIGANQKENRYYGSTVASNNHTLHGPVLAGGSVTVPNAPTPGSNKEGRYRPPKPEKRRDSISTLPVLPDKRPSLSTPIGPGASPVPVVRPVTPNVNNHGAVLSSPAAAAVTTPANPTAVAYNLQQLGGAGSASNAIAAAASQAIMTTQQMQQGRRTASLKASYEAIHGAGGGPTEFWISRDIASAASAAAAQTVMGGTEKKQKKKASSALATQAQTTTMPPSVPAVNLGGTVTLASSSSSVSMDSTDLLSSSVSLVNTVGGIGPAVPPLSMATLGVGGASTSATAAANRTNSASSSTSTASSLTPSSNLNIGENGLVVDQAPEGEWSYDPNEPRYCTCQQVSYGDMVACDNDACPYEWFHYPCVGITQPPKGKWYCPKCTASMRRRGNRKN